MKEQDIYLKQLIEAALFVADRPLSLDELNSSVLVNFALSKKKLTQLLDSLGQDYQERGIELKLVASGYRFQAKTEFKDELSHLWPEKAPKYSRALLETLALIAYKQPITRGEIENVRGVSVSSHIIKTLIEREWIKVIGHKEVPGRPALYATTKEFLDYFSLKSLAEMPELEAVADLSLELDKVQL